MIDHDYRNKLKNLFILACKTHDNYSYRCMNMFYAFFDKHSSAEDKSADDLAFELAAIFDPEYPSNFESIREDHVLDFLVFLSSDYSTPPESFWESLKSLFISKYECCPFITFSDRQMTYDALDPNLLHMLKEQAQDLFLKVQLHQRNKNT